MSAQKCILLFGICCQIWYAFQVQVTSGCPFSDSMTIGRKLEEAQVKLSAELADQNFLIYTGLAASNIFSSGPMENETVVLYKRSMSLHYAQQLYLQTCPAAGDAVPAVLLRSLEHEVPLSERSREKPICDSSYPYARPTGVCNNLDEPNQGGSYTPFSRWLPASYADGFYAVRKGADGFDLPSARLIGNRIADINSYVLPPLPPINHFAIMCGQYITHDMAWRQTYQTLSSTFAPRCCTSDNKRQLPEGLRYYGCMPVTVPTDDMFYGPLGVGCLDYMRSQPVFPNDGSMGTVQTSSSVTHYIDHSNIYGSTDAIQQSVRAFSGGELLNSANGLLPQTPNCTAPGCYFTGDLRGAFYPTLTLLHSVFVRLHNYLARGLRAVHPLWSDDQTFQETKRVTTAVYQNIVYNEWAPLVLGKEMAAQRNISWDGSSPYSGWYNKSLDGSTMNDFTSGAFRMLHVNTPSEINLFDNDYELVKKIPLEESLTYGPELLEDNYENIARGLLHDAASFSGYPEVIRNKIFKDKNPRGFGLDMLAIDIMRSRDNGLPSYAAYYERCSGTKIMNWWDLLFVIPYSSILILQSTYASANDVDLIVGLLLEVKIGLTMGPVTRCIVAEQLHRSKNGNRFFYSLPNGGNPFSEKQLNSIHKITFADVLCLTTALASVPDQAFVQLSFMNPLVKCTNKTVDFSLW